MKRIALLGFLALCPAFGQVVSNVKIQPNCVLPVGPWVVAGTYNFQIDNAFSQCVAWTVTYASSGFSVVSIDIQAAVDAGNTPGAYQTWATAGGTVASGINPNTATTQAESTFTGYFRWVRVHAVLTGTGALNGSLTGNNSATGGGGGGGGGCTAPCTVIGPNATGAAPTQPPVFVSSVDGAGNVLPLQACTNSVVINTASSGLTQLIAASGTKVIRVCHWSGVPTTAVAVQLEYGTGSACGTGTTALSGNYGSAAGVLAFAFDFGPEAALLTPAGKALCLNLGAAIQLDGTITYSQY
jgi:hypothetical protein